MLQNTGTSYKGIEQQCCTAGKQCALTEAVGEGPAAHSALLTAITRVLYLVVGQVLDGDFLRAFQRALSIFANSLLDMLWLCACVGAIHFELHSLGNKISRTDMESVGIRLHGTVFPALQQVMQVKASFCLVCNLESAHAHMSAHC